MARIYPERIAQSTASSAERRLYELLRDQLDDRYVVFHGASWLDKAKGAEPQDGEADFVLAHPDLGIMVLEVKGGQIRRVGAANTWESVDRDGEAHPIKDPFEQVRGEAFSLRHVAEQHGDWPANRVRFARAVAFPDCIYERTLVPHGRAEIVIDERHLSQLGPRIRRIFDWWSFSGDAEFDGSGLGPLGMAAIESLLSRSFAMASPLRVAIEADEHSIVQLTEHQFELLDFLRHQRHALITGVAGAGKTMLAAEHARRLAGHMDVLLLCVDRALARHLKDSIGTVDRVHVMTFGELTAQLLSEAGVDLLRMDENPAWWRTEAPSLLRRSISRVARRFDAIIVDEAQDIDSSWWPPIIDLLADSNRGIVYVFGDDNQDLYHGRIDAERGIVMPLALPRFELHQNRRTTRAIHDFAHRYFIPLPGSPTPVSIGPPGRPVVVAVYPTVDDTSSPANLNVAAQACRERLRETLAELSHKGEVRTDDIMILSPRHHRSWLVGPGANPWIGSFKLVPGLTITGHVMPPPPHRSEFRVVRIQDFKGLETKVVILVEIDGRIPADDLNAILYVGSTRARTHLVVIADEARAQGIGPRRAERSVHAPVN